MNDNSVIRSPILTEKTNSNRALLNKYWFKVGVRANKIMIKNALEKLFKVRVTKCNIINIKSKKVGRRGRTGYTSAWKKAIVTLKQPKSGEKFKGNFEFYEGI